MDLVYRTVDIRSLTNEEMQYALNLMSEERKATAARFRAEGDRRRTAAGELLARRMIAERLGIPAEDIVFGRTARGKPYAVGLPVEFSVSHSGNLVICAAADKPVGADIQIIRPVKDRLITRVCSERELDYVISAGSSPSEKLPRFFRVWTGKEAYLKYTGTGIVSDLREVCVFGDEISRYLSFFMIDDYAVSIFYNKQN